VPEICGEGGRFCNPDDILGIAAALNSLLDNEPEWIRVSERARANAARFTWDRCSRPLADLFQEMLTRP
jgi:glycosyltransferase involved in cell wall biosynthesis